MRNRQQPAPTAPGDRTASVGAVSIAQRPRAARYLVAAGAIAVALAIRAIMQPLLNDTAPLILMLLAPILSAFYGGAGPGVFATITAGLLGIAFFSSPAGSALPPNLAEWARLLVFFGEGGLITWVIDARARAHIALARDHEALLLAQHESAERERRIREILLAVPSAILLVDQHGRILFANPQAETLFGYTRAELLATSAEQLLPEEQRAAHLGARSRYQDDPTTRATCRVHEVNARRADGTTFAAEVSLSPLTDENRPLVLAAVMDISARKAAEAERERTAQSRAHLAAIVESHADAIFSVSVTDATIASWNKGATQILGYEPQDAVGLPVVRLIPDERMDEEIAHRESVVSRGTVTHYTTEYVALNGHRLPVAVTLSPIHADTGQIVGISAIVRDITQQKRAEDAQRASRMELQRVADMAPVMLVHCDRDGRYLFVNKSFAECVGRRPQDIIGRPVYEFTDDTVHRMFTSHAIRALTGERVDFECEIHHRALGPRLMHCTHVPYTEPGSAQVVGFVAAITDITERRQAEFAVQEALQRFRDLAESMPAIVWTAGPDGKTDYVAQKPLASYVDAPAKGSTVPRLGELVHPDDLDALRQSWRDSVRTGDPYLAEFRLRHRDGLYRWHLGRAVAARNDAGAIIKWYGSATDIHERKQLEEESRRLAARMETILEAITDVFAAIDHEGRFTYLNEPAARLFMRDRLELVGRSMWEEFPDLRETPLGKHCQEASARGRSARFAMCRESTGTWFDVSIYPAEGGLALYLRDVTRQRAMEEHLSQAQRLESIGQLTGGVAHDFNNLLTVILGNSCLLAEDVAGNDATRELAQQIVQAAERGADLTQRLLAFGRRQTLDPKVLDVNHLVAGMEGLLRRSLGEQVEMELVRGPGLWHTFVDPAQLESALLNLTINARDAMAQGGRLTIETANVHLDADYAARHVDVQAGQYVMVAVSDSGRGIPPQDLQRVFEPFFTTKEKGKGTGLGLAMVYGFVKQSGGHIKIYSEVDQGTTVRMYLPRTTSGISRDDPVTDEAIGAEGSETVLLVEDDEFVRRIARYQLTSLGYRVLEAEDGPRALEILRQCDDIDLLFTDVVMPGGMSGKDLADRAVALRPEIKVLFTSGYTENSIVHHGRLDPGVRLIAKPYRRTALARAVHDALGRKRR